MFTDTDRQPDFINPEGVKWWEQPDFANYIERKGFPPGLIKVYLTESPNTERDYVLISKKGVLYDTKSMEQMAVHLDQLHLLFKTDGLDALNLT